MFGYIREKVSGRVISYWDLEAKPSDTEEHEFVECQENEKPPIWVDNSPVYSPDTLISWALQQVFAEQLIPHMAAFLDFANKATQVSYNNFIAYATVVDMVSTANTIADKAIELGADIQVGG